MSIDRVNISNSGIDRSQAAKATEPARHTEKSRQVSTGSDSVALSTKAKEMDRLANSVEQSRADRLNQVRAALDSGAYRVSATEIAKKLIEANTKS